MNGLTRNGATINGCAYTFSTIIPFGPWSKRDQKACGMTFPGMSNFFLVKKCVAVPHQTMGFAKCRSMWPRVVCQDMLCMCFLLQQLAVIAKWQDLQQDRIVHIFLPSSIESFPMCCTRGSFTGLFNQPLDNGPTMNKIAVLLDLDLRLFCLCLEWRQLALFMALVTL